MGFTRDPANNNAQTLIGAVSWGFGCANPGQLGIYAEVSYFRDWIDSQIPDMNTCAPPTNTFEGWTCENSTGSTPTAPNYWNTTTLPPTTTTTTPTAPEECADKDKIPVLRTIAKLRKVKTVESCSVKCTQNSACEYYKWKTHKKVAKRQCHLMQIQYIPKRGWWSGPRGC